MSGVELILAMSLALSTLWLGIAPACIGYGVALLIAGRRDAGVPACARCSHEVTRADLAGGAPCRRCDAAPIEIVAPRRACVGRALRWIVLPVVVWFALLIPMVVVFAMDFSDV